MTPHLEPVDEMMAEADVAGTKAVMLGFDALLFRLHTVSLQVITTVNAVDAAAGACCADYATCGLPPPATARATQQLGAGS